MTDINARIAKKKGWRRIDFGKGEVVWKYMSDPPIYKDEDAPVHFTTDGRLAGEAITEMQDAAKDGWEFSCEHSTIDGLESLKWRMWMNRFTDDASDYKHFGSESDEFLQALWELWLEWSEG